MAGTIDSLQIEIQASANDASKKIDVLSASLANLKNNAKGGAGLNTLSKQIRTLGEAVNSLSGSNASKLSSLARALQSLSTVQKASGLSSTINSLNKLKNVDFSGVSEEKMRSLSSALSVLGDVQKADGLKSTITQLSKIPKVMESLDKTDLGKFAKQMQEVANAVKPLATEMDKVAKGFDAFPTKIQKLIKSTNQLTASTTKTSRPFSIFTGSFVKFGVYTYLFQRVSNLMGNWLNESNDYVENLNLFTVSMGEYASEAQKYAEAVQDALGIDSSEWMRNQAVFMQIASGFGVVSEKAALMSKNLTQIGYDKYLSPCRVIYIEKQGEPTNVGCAA